MSAEVVIVGAGPAGATLAYLLASRGIPVRLVERQRDFTREFRGEVVLPSGSHVLSQLGIDDALAQVPRRPPSALELWFEGQLVVSSEVDLAFFDGVPPIAMSQPALLEALITEAQKLPTFSFERGASVSKVIRENDRVVGVEVHHDGATRELRGDLVIGTDGRGSVVRRSCGFEAKRDPLPMDIVWCKLPAPLADGDHAVARVYVTAGHLLIAYRAPDDLLQIGWVIAKGTYGAIRRQGIAEWLDELSNRVDPAFGAHLRDNKDAAVHPFLLSTVSDHVTRWWMPGVLVLGDAAHTMSPVGAQGINVALEDTVSAANHLVPALRDGGDAAALDAACRAVEAERRPVISQIQRLQAQPPRVIFGKSFLSRAILGTLPRLLRLEAVQRLAARQAGTFLRGADLRLRV